MCYPNPVLFGLKSSEVFCGQGHIPYFFLLVSTYIFAKFQLKDRFFFFCWPLNSSLTQWPYPDTFVNPDICSKVKLYLLSHLGDKRQNTPVHRQILPRGHVSIHGGNDLLFSLTSCSISLHKDNIHREVLHDFKKYQEAVREVKPGQVSGHK